MTSFQHIDGKENLAATGVSKNITNLLTPMASPPLDTMDFLSVDNLVGEGVDMAGNDVGDASSNRSSIYRLMDNVSNSTISTASIILESLPIVNGFLPNKNENENKLCNDDKYNNNMDAPKEPCTPTPETMKKLSNFRSTEEFIKFWGYPCESHYISTQDGHILSIHRIPCGRKQYSKLVKNLYKSKNTYEDCHGLIDEDLNINNKGFSQFKLDFIDLGKQGKLGRPIILWHGLSLCDSIFVSSPGGPKYNLAFYLADNGYDVWLANSRGNRFSKGVHDKITNAISIAQNNNYTMKDKLIDLISPLTYIRGSYNIVSNLASYIIGDKKNDENTNDIPDLSSPYVSSENYWDFTLDDLARYDVPAVINYVLNQREAKKLLYCGFSQSTTIMFAALTIYPDLSDKIECFIGLSPALSPAIEGPLLKLIDIFGPKFAFKIFGSKEFFPFMKYIVNYAPNAFYGWATHFTLRNVINWNCNKWPKEWRANLYCNMYGGTSVLNMTHWFHIISKKNFEKLIYEKAIERSLEGSNDTYVDNEIDQNNYENRSGLEISSIFHNEGILIKPMKNNEQKRTIYRNRRQSIQGLILKNQENSDEEDDLSKFFVKNKNNKDGLFANLFNSISNTVEAITSTSKNSTTSLINMLPIIGNNKKEDKVIDHEFPEMLGFETNPNDSNFYLNKEFDDPDNDEMDKSVKSDTPSNTSFVDPKYDVFSNRPLTRSNSEILALWDEQLNDGVSYPVHNIRIPIYLFCGTDDTLCNIPFLKDHLYAKTTKIFTIEGGEHMDLIWGIDAHNYWEQAVKIFKSFDNKNDESK